MRGLGLVILAAALCACGAGRVSGGYVQRPVTLPAGEHQAQVGVVAANGAFAVLPTYRYGVTDALDYQFPAALAYRIGGGRLAVVVAGGVDSVGLAQRETFFIDDPRRPQGRRETPVLVSRFFARATLKVRVHEMALLIHGVATNELRGIESNAQFAGGGAGWVFEPFSRTTVTLAAEVGAASIGADRRLALRFGGSSTDGRSVLVDTTRPKSVE